MQISNEKSRQRFLSSMPYHEYKSLFPDMTPRIQLDLFNVDL